MQIINAPSLANCSLLELGSQTAQLVEGGVQWFHVDIMDGHYVPNLCFPVRMITELKATYPQIEVDVHLMVTNPEDYIVRLTESGADWISFPIDSTRFSRRLLSDIHVRGAKAGVVLNPSQPVSELVPLLPFVDYVVLMTVEPGYAGQKFMPDSLDRLAELTQMRKEHNLSFLISIDGGVDYENAIACARLGAEVYVTGIYTVFCQKDSLALACTRFVDTLQSEVPMVLNEA